MIKRDVVLLILCLIAVGFFPASVLAQGAPPPLPHSFYGTVEVNGDPAPVGAVVEARGSNVMVAVEGNPITVTVAGKYGGPTRNEMKLYVQGALQDDQPIEFYVNGVKAQCARPGGAWQESYPYIQGVVTQLNLRVGEGQQPAGTTPTATASSTATYTPQPPAGQVTVTETVVPTQELAATETPPAAQPTATRQASPTASSPTAPVPTTTGAPAQSGQSATPTALPGAVVTKPTEEARPTVPIAPTTAPQAVVPAVTPSVTATATPPPTQIAPVRSVPTETPAQMALRPNATAQPILAEAKAPEAVQSTLSQTSINGSGRNVALWGGAGVLLLAVAIGVLIKVRRP